MKYIIFIVGFILFGLITKAQLPSGFPQQKSSGWFEQGYQMSDSATIIAKRDTNWTPRFAGTIVLWQHASVDTAYWFHNGAKWIKLADQGTIITNTNIANASLRANDNYSQNWAGKQLFIDSISSASFFSKGTVSGRTTLAAISINAGASISNGFEMSYYKNKIGGATGDSLSNSVFLDASTKITEVNAKRNDLNYRSRVWMDYLQANLESDSATSFFSRIKVTPHYIQLHALDSVLINGAIAVATPDSALGIVFSHGEANGNSRTYKLVKYPASTGSGTVTSVALSMPSAFAVTGSPITTSGTFSVSGNGTSAQYIRGNGTLATFDTAAIPSFSVKVRSLFSGTSPITYNQASGTFGLADIVTAGTCTNCTVTYNSKGQATFFSSGSGGSVNEGYGININIDTIKVDTVTIDARYPKIYNIVSAFGAKPDGKRGYDAAMTSGSNILTCASCVFSSEDVGKAIRVEGAASSGDLVTTISGFTNSTTITLTNNATNTVTSDTIHYGTDNTPMIQRAIDSASTYGDAKVWIPAGIYVLAGPLITSYEGANPNAQLVWKTSVYGTSSFIERKWFTIEGVSDMNHAPSTFGDSISPLYGSVLYSIIDGSGTLPSVFGTKSNGGIFGDFNYNCVAFKNLSILVARNNNAGGPTVGGINGLFCGALRLENLYIGISGSINRQPEPIHDVAGAIVGKLSSEIYSSIKNVSTYAFKYGFIYAEGVTIDHATAHASIFAHTFTNCITPIDAGMIIAMWSKNSIYIPNHNLFGLIPVSTTFFNIQTLAGELYNGSSVGVPSWLDYQYVINDSGSLGRGNISGYALGQAEVGGGNALFNKYGGDSIYVRLMGSRIDPNVRTFTNEIRSNSSFIFEGSAGGGANYFYNLSGLSNSSILRIQPTVTNGTQIMSLAPSGTGDAVLSPIMSAFNMYNTSLGSGYPISGNANTERLTFAAIGTTYKISSEIEGTGSHRPITFQTAGISNQFRLNTNGEVEVNGTTSDQFKVLGNSPAGRTSIYIQNAASNGNASVLVDNNRGSLASHGGFLTAGQTFASSFFGVSAADKTMLYHGGASGTGFLFGTLNSSPIIIGTNNVEGIRINISNEIQIGSSTDLGAFTLQNTGGLYQNGTFSLRGTLAGTSSMNILVKGTDSTIYQIPVSSIVPSMQSGRWLPTITGATNATGIIVDSSQYIRQGDIVSFTVRVTITITTGATPTAFDFSLPITSDIGVDEDLIAISSTSGGTAGYAYGDPTNETGEVSFTPANNGVVAVVITGHYKITPP